MASSGLFSDDAMTDPRPPVRLTPEEQKRRRKRSIVLALVLGGLVLLFYIVTIAKLGPGVLKRPI